VATAALAQVAAPPVTVTTGTVVLKAAPGAGPVTVGPGQPGAVVVGPDGKPRPAGEPAKAEGSKLPNETPRLAKLKQLTYDRRPSAVLKAWAPEPKPDAAADKPAKDPKEAAWKRSLPTSRRPSR
jgi:hypothetical protein